MTVMFGDNNPPTGPAGRRWTMRRNRIVTHPERPAMSGEPEEQKNHRVNQSFSKCCHDRSVTSAIGPDVRPMPTALRVRTLLVGSIAGGEVACRCSMVEARSFNACRCSSCWGSQAVR